MLRSHRIRQVRLIVSLIIVTLFGAHSLGHLPISLLDRLDKLLYDQRLVLFADGQREERIAIVDIDEKSLAAEGHWPWSREKIGYLLDALFDYYRIRLLAFDVVFSEGDRSLDIEVAEKLLHRVFTGQVSREEGLASLRSALVQDERLAESLRDRPVVLGYFFSPRQEPQSPGVIPPAVIPVGFAPVAAHLYEARSFGGNLPVLQSAARTAGFINAPFLDDDGGLRRVPLLLRYGEGVYESLPLAVVRTLLGGSEIRLESGKGYGGAGDGERLEWVGIDHLSVPVDAASAVLIPFHAEGERVRYLSATDVLNGRVQREALVGKVVLLGTTAAGLSDLYPTPAGRNFPGVEVHANLIGGMLDGALKWRPAYVQGGELAQILLLGLVAMGLFPRLQAGAMTLALLSLCALVIGVNFTLWDGQGIDSHLATPLLCLVLLYLAQMFFGYFHETRRKNRLGALFGHYVPPQLVEEMSRSDEEYSLGGESRRMTVLFCDIRGFTAISETLPPARLCSLINEILTLATQAVHGNKGTIDKYMGDAVMAFWGAPMPDGAHASHAIAAARAILDALRKLEASPSFRDTGPIRVGIGLNTGIMSVGNMGSEFRMAYTVMGDAVNLASRLEGLTKEYGVDIIVSEQTKQAAPEYCYRELDQVLVKGRREPVILFQPLGLKSEASPEQLREVEAMERALQAYRSCRWGEAESLFKGLLEASGHDPLFGVYLRRIARFKETPPGADWAGIYDHGRG